MIALEWPIDKQLGIHYTPLAANFQIHATINKPLQNPHPQA